MKLNPVHYFCAGFPMLAGYVALSPDERTNPSVCDADVAGRFCFAAAEDGLHQENVKEAVL